MIYLKEYNEYNTNEGFFRETAMCIISICLYNICYPYIDTDPIDVRDAIENNKEVSIEVKYTENQNWGDFKNGVYSNAPNVERATKKLSVVLDKNLSDNIEIDGDTLRIKYIDVIDNLEEELSKELNSKLVGKERGEVNQGSPKNSRKRVTGTYINNIKKSF